jgi:2-polyprenyl-6-hydroxyphenyl methylase/3-demethylubiquinone-9 3-methyltransferase
MKSSTINKKEIEKFSKMASEWWNPLGKFKPLHKFNPIRIKYIRDSASKHFKIKSNNQPLKNLNILDIGCGGGLLSEPMSKLGAYVTGVDASKTNINIAKIHSKKNKLKINYICGSPENLKINQKFDIILNMEIVEHVEDINYFITKSSQFLKKDGLMYVATLNKTLKSYLFAIIGAEYILKWLPIGTHEWDKFVEPSKLIQYGKQNSLKLEKLDGMVFNPIMDKWNISKDSSVNYIIQFKKI